MKRYYLRLMMLFLALALLASLFYLIKGFKKNQPDTFIDKGVEYRLYEDRAKALDRFVVRFFLQQGLMQTNLKESQQGELASGEDILSESVGLMLQYYVKTDQSHAFEEHLKLANEVLLKKNGLYQWRYRTGQVEAVSASVDDLRIIKALLLAKSKWGVKDYEDQAISLSKALIKHSTKGGKLLSFDQPNAEQAPLFYYDLATIEYLSGLDDNWNSINKNAQRLLSEQKHLDLPFYEDSLDDQKAYRMIENLLILLYLSEASLLKDSDMNWYKDQLEKGAVYAKYDEKGRPVSLIESPAIYGLIAQIAKNMDNKSLYQMACKKLNEMQHFEQDDYRGGFINIRTKDAYSFDQLMGLLGY